eukprot:6478823-Amphidinium_carterae.2
MLAGSLGSSRARCWAEMTPRAKKAKRLNRGSKPQAGKKRKKSKRLSAATVEHAKRMAMLCLQLFPMSGPPAWEKLQEVGFTEELVLAAESSAAEQLHSSNLKPADVEGDKAASASKRGEDPIPTMHGVLRCVRFVSVQGMLAKHRTQE